MTGSLPNVFCNIVNVLEPSSDPVMFVFQVCFCDIDEEEGSRTLTILQKTFGNDPVMLVFQVCFCDIDEEEGSRTLTILPSSSSISQKQT
jgi:hypothetical protein